MTCDKLALYAVHLVLNTISLVLIFLKFLLVTLLAPIILHATQESVSQLGNYDAPLNSIRRIQIGLTTALGYFSIMSGNTVRQNYKIFCYPYCVMSFDRCFFDWWAWSDAHSTFCSLFDCWLRTERKAPLFFDQIHIFYVCWQFDCLSRNYSRFHNATNGAARLFL